MNKELKRYLISTGVTFVATFLTIIGASMGTLTDANVTAALIAGIVLSAARTAIKVTFEYAIPIAVEMLNKLKKK